MELLLNNIMITAIINCEYWDIIINESYSLYQLVGFIWQIQRFDIYTNNELRLVGWQATEKLDTKWE